MELQGKSLIGFRSPSRTGSAFSAVNPDTGQPLSPSYFSATQEDIDQAAGLAEQAFQSYSRWSGKQKAGLLRQVSSAVEGLGDALIERASLETGLPLPRLRGELARTCNQLCLFAEVVEEGSWVDARIDRPDRDRKPIPKPDIRSMLRPVGPVVVFGASNFPLAFSVAGGDTASALAAGNPVVVKAHPAHPGTSEMVARALIQALRRAEAPEGTFSLLFDSGTDVGKALVQHPQIKAGGFTGSHAAGRALMDIAAGRPHPIPFFAEMSSTNPVFILPEALAQRADQIGTELHASVTLGFGQFCTKPGLVFLARDTASEKFVKKLADLMGATPESVLLTAGICRSYAEGVARRISLKRVSSPTSSNPGFRASAALFEVDIEELQAKPALAEELFGPSTLIVRYASHNELLRYARSLEGHLTATIHGSEEDLVQESELIAILEQKVGRLIFNGYPTGVEVSHAIVHGGPFPATSDPRFTSVGTKAIMRFARPVCFQDFPDQSLLLELQNENPLGILRAVDGQLTRAHVKRVL